MQMIAGTVQMIADDDSVSSIFAPFRQADLARPFVVAQLGQSLDGRIATITGHSRFINRAGALDHLHRIRANVDAVVVGIGTILADDPALTVRRVEGQSPARVVIDPSGRLLETAKCLNPDGVRRFVIRGQAGRPLRGAETIIVDRINGMLSPLAIIAELHSRGMGRILVEGGSRTVSTFLQANALDRLHMLVAPLIIGSGRTGLELTPILSLDEALRPNSHVHVFADGDVLFDCDLRQARQD